MPGRRRFTGSGRTVVEVAVAALLLVVLTAQLLSYPPTDDPDPDGFVSYAQQLLATRTLPESRRLPGYPAFLAVISTLSPRPIARNVYWVQLALMLAFSVASWAAVRRWTGPLTATLFLAILAAPNFFARMSVVMLPDAVYSMLFLPVFVAICWWILAPRTSAGRSGWLWLVPFAIGLFVLQTLRPTTAALTILLLPSLCVGLAAQRGLGHTALPLRPALARMAALAVVALVVFVAVDRLLDTGARAYNADVPLYRVIVFLPPADESPAEQRIEAAKARFRELEGQPIERAKFLTYVTFKYYVEFSVDDVRAVWLARLRAHPLAYIQSVLEDVRLGHYELARTVVPFFLDLDRISLFRVLYPPDNGSPASELFRRTGLVVLEREPYPATFPLQVEAVQAALRVVAVWLLTALGIWQLGRRYPGQVASLSVLAILFVLMTAATNTVHARYLLPFMPLISLAEAAGMVWIGWTLLAAGRPGASHSLG